MTPTGFIIFVTAIIGAFFLGTYVDKRRFKNKAKELNLDDWEEDLSGDVRRYERHNNIKSVK